MYEEVIDCCLALKMFEIQAGIKKVGKPMPSRDLVHPTKATHPEPTYDHLISSIRSLEHAINTKLCIDDTSPT